MRRIWLYNSAMKPCILSLVAIALASFAAHATIRPKGAPPALPVKYDLRGKWKQIRDVTPESRPAFLSIMALSWTYTPSIIKAAIDNLGDGYVFVTPEQVVELYRGYRAWPVRNAGQAAGGEE